MASFVPCGPCGHERLEKSAEKWCTDCNEGFCNICEKAHKSMKISRYHNLITIDEYRKIENVNVRFECEEHGSKLEMYCKLHEMAICMACFPAKHKGCFDAIIPLAEAAKNAKTSTALVDLEHTINNTLQNIQGFDKDREAAAERIETQIIVIKKMIFDTRENINKHLDDLERKLLNELTTTSTSYRSQYSKLQNQLSNIEKKIKPLQEQTTQLKRFASDLHLFLSTHQVNKGVHDGVKSLKEAFLSFKNYNIDIEIHQGINSLLKDVNHFARIKVDESTISCPFKEANIDQAQMQVQPRRSVHDTKLQLRRKFTIKQTGNEMYIAGCTILANGNLLIADHNGQNVLMEYNEDGNFIRDIPVSARPWDLTVIDTDHIAVSYRALCYIEVIDIRKKIVKTVKFKNYCGGISYNDGKIYVVVKNEGIVVLDMDGTKINTIKCSTDVYDITTSQSRIYFTQMKQHTVNCCTGTGEEIWNFEDILLNSPGGIAVDKNQNLFVVGKHSNNLLMVQDDGKLSKTLRTEADGFNQPRCVCYNKEKNILLVCNSRYGSAFLFSVI
ncbi:uncharacterized protein LOC127738810 [Mytilus californianus]|uniref:uncharacterized protein LOC127738810 n=1 Tax=Mytilus californianus TaxID=6549 RepID=UPI002246AC32|nr:uncharacterized protein LOC127738810 [Mytilus californianus]